MSNAIIRSGWVDRLTSGCLIVGTYLYGLLSSQPWQHQTRNAA